MGKSTNLGEIVITGPATSCPGGVANTNTETLTSLDDGDQLVLRMDDVSCPISSVAFHGTGRWVVIGGTGRFAGASGAGTADGGADFNNGTFHPTLTGTVSQPKA